jgi:hypothetical protein
MLMFQIQSFLQSIMFEKFVELTLPGKDLLKADYGVFERGFVLESHKFF